MIPYIRAIVNRIPLKNLSGASRQRQRLRAESEAMGLAVWILGTYLISLKLKMCG